MPTQVEESVRYAIQNRIRILPERVFIEDISGVTPIASRPQGQKAMALLEQKAVRAIVGHRVDRYSRDIVDLLATVKKVTRSGAQFHAVDVGRVKNELDVVLVIKGWAGGDEHARITEKMSAGRYRKAELGKVVGSKDAPYGYRYLRDERHKAIALEIYEPEARVVRIIFRWCLYGEDGKHPMTLWQIAKRLTGDHVLPPAQSRGYTKIGRSRIRLGVWNDGSVGKIVHNQTYAGIWRYGKTDTKGQPRPAEDHKLVKVEPLVSSEMWEHAQAQLKRNKAVSKRNAKRDYVLRGMVKCRCGRKMSGRTTVGGLSYYVCTSHSESREFCDQKLVRAEKIEEYVWHQIERFFKNGRLFTLGLYKAQKDELKSLQPKREELEIVEQQLIECEKEARNCAAALKRPAMASSQSNFNKTASQSTDIMTSSLLVARRC